MQPQNFNGDREGAEAFCRRYIEAMPGLSITASLESPTDGVNIPYGTPFLPSLGLIIEGEDAEGLAVHSDAQAVTCVLAELDDLVQCYTLDGEEAGCSLAIGGPKIIFNYYGAPGSNITAMGLHGRELGTVKAEAMQALLDGGMDAEYPEMVAVRWGGPDGLWAWLTDLRETAWPSMANIGVGEHVLAWNLTSVKWGMSMPTMEQKLVVR